MQVPRFAAEYERSQQQRSDADERATIRYHWSTGTSLFRPRPSKRKHKLKLTALARRKPHAASTCCHGVSRVYKDTQCSCRELNTDRATESRDAAPVDRHRLCRHREPHGMHRLCRVHHGPPVPGRGMSIHPCIFILQTPFSSMSGGGCRVSCLHCSCNGLLL